MMKKLSISNLKLGKNINKVLPFILAPFISSYPVRADAPHGGNFAGQGAGGMRQNFAGANHPVAPTRIPDRPVLRNPAPIEHRDPARPPEVRPPEASRPEERHFSERPGLREHEFREHEFRHHESAEFRDRDRNRFEHSEFERHGFRHHFGFERRHFFGRHVHFLPYSCFRVWSGPVWFWYYDGIYYRPYGDEYVVVTPPVGAIVSVLPDDYYPVIIGGMTYYTDGTTYYQRVTQGYQVINPPVVVQGQTAEDTVTVQLTNDRGATVSIVLRKSGNGYIGPQGEYYDHLPTADELRPLYGRG